MSRTCSKNLSITIEPPGVELLAYWNMDEASGQRSDSKGTNHLVGGRFSGPVGGVGPSSMAGVISNAALIDGNNNSNQGLYIASPSTELIFDPARGFSMAIWYLRSTTGPAVPGTVQIIGCGGGTYSVPTANGIQFTLTTVFNAGTTSAAVDGFGASVQTINLGALTADVFHLIVLWIDPADWKLRVQVDNGTVQVSASAITPPTVFDSWYIVAFEGATQTKNFAIDEWAMFKGVLTSAQADYIWNGGVGRTLGAGYPGT